MAESIYKWAKLRRTVFSGGGKILFAFLAMAGSYAVSLYTIFHNYQTVRGDTSMLILGLSLILLIGALFLGLQWYAEYMKRTYDSTWALKFQSDFESPDMLKRRVDAATCILNNKDDLDKTDQRGDELCVIDWILDFFEDIGFYVHGMQISPEVAYHHFYYYIRGYWQWTEPYVKEWQKKPHEKSRWEHIEELYKTTCEIATRKKESTALGLKELLLFIQDEKELLDEYVAGQSCPKGHKT
jgi:hypothetical protein